MESSNFKGCYRQLENYNTLVIGASRRALSPFGWVNRWTFSRAINLVVNGNSSIYGIIGFIGLGVLTLKMSFLVVKGFTNHYLSYLLVVEWLISFNNKWESIADNGVISNICTWHGFRWKTKFKIVTYCSWSNKIYEKVWLQWNFHQIGIRIRRSKSTMHRTECNHCFNWLFGHTVQRSNVMNVNGYDARDETKYVMKCHTRNCHPLTNTRSCQ